MLAKHGTVRVIECNLRASRSLPFVSKVTGNNFVREAIRRMLGVRRPITNHTLDLDYVGCKVPMFSFPRLVGADPLLGVEMASTGEVGCFGDDAHESLLHGLLATGFRFPTKGVLLSLGKITEKYAFHRRGPRPAGGARACPCSPPPAPPKPCNHVGIRVHLADARPRAKARPWRSSKRASVDLVINVPREYDEMGRPDGYLIRRRAVDAEIPLVTDLMLARALVEAMRFRNSPAALQASTRGTSTWPASRWLCAETFSVSRSRSTLAR